MTPALHLSRLVLDPRTRDVRRDLADCHALHRRVMSGFPTAVETGASAREAFGVLYRLDTRPLATRPTLLVQSGVAPDWSRLPSGYLDPSPGLDGLDNPAVKPVAASYGAIAAGDILAFRLRANPTRRISDRGGSTNPKAGKRVALLGERDQLAWLERKALDGGFGVLSVRAEANDLRPADTGVPPDMPAVRTMPAADQTGHRPRRSSEGGSDRLTFGAVVFEGRLRVLDPDRFRATLATGIGSGKAYGFGLLSVAPVAGGGASAAPNPAAVRERSPA